MSKPGRVRVCVRMRVRMCVRVHAQPKGYSQHK